MCTLFVQMRSICFSAASAPLRENKVQYKNGTQRKGVRRGERQ